MNSEQPIKNAERAVFELRATLEPEVAPADSSPLRSWEKEKSRRRDQFQRLAPWLVRLMMLMMLGVLIGEMWYLINIFEFGLAQTGLPPELVIRQLGPDLLATPAPPPLP